MKRLFLIVSLLPMLSACAANSSVMNGLSLGMTKSQVLQIVGKPVSTSAHENVEYLNYRLTEAAGHDGIFWPYFVRLVDGKVEAFGRTGDFNSTRNNALDINVNK